ncbi:hypothetical protein AVT06_14370 [Pseudomonas aeruginosa]|nr:hypothetical protein AAY82_19840 [Pseudomonas aeruginosa]KZE30784.1 hypothetical protein AVT06_14370 [Pseudomonas aeruginosa]
MYEAYSGRPACLMSHHRPTMSIGGMIFRRTSDCSMMQKRCDAGAQRSSFRSHTSVSDSRS